MNLKSVISNLIFKFKLSKANPLQRAELLRDKFYFLGKNVRLYTTKIGTEPYLISIHDNVTCASNVVFINHDVSCFNMARFLGIKEDEVDKVGPIILHENSFIGAETMIMPNCSVGKNSVVAARSLVSKNIPDNEVWGGVPAKFIMTTEEYANKVLANSKKYPWKYDSEGNFLSIPESEKVLLRQKYFFKDHK